MRITLLTIAIAAAACGGKGTDLEGIYTIDAWNENPASCADPGPSELANHDAFGYVELKDYFGQSALAFDECTDAVACATDANGEDVLFGWTFLMDRGSDADGWTGTVTFAFAPDTNNNCSGLLSTATLTVDGDGLGVTVREEDIDVPSFAPRDGECDTDDAAEAAEGLPCTSVETVHATFSAPF